MRRIRKNRKDSGFALLLILLFGAVIAIRLYTEIPRVTFESQRQKEQLLIERGEQYKRSIQLFVKANNRWPTTIDELETFNNRHYLRRRFKDPMTGKDEWRLVHIQNGMLTDSVTTKKKGDQEQAASTLGQYVGVQAGVGQTLDSGGQGNGGVNQALRARASDRSLAGSNELPSQLQPEQQAGAAAPQPGQQVTGTAPLPGQQQPGNAPAQPQPGQPVYGMAPQQPGLQPGGIAPQPQPQPGQQAGGVVPQPGLQPGGIQSQSQPQPQPAQQAGTVAPQQPGLQPGGIAPQPQPQPTQQAGGVAAQPGLQPGGIQTQSQPQPTQQTGAMAPQPGLQPGGMVRQPFSPPTQQAGGMVPQPGLQPGGVAPQTQSQQGQQTGGVAAQPGLQPNPTNVNPVPNPTAMQQVPVPIPMQGMTGQPTSQFGQQGAQGVPVQPGQQNYAGRGGTGLPTSNQPGQPGGATGGGSYVGSGSSVGGGGSYVGGGSYIGGQPTTASTLSVPNAPMVPAGGMNPTGSFTPPQRPQPAPANNSQNSGMTNRPPTSSSQPGAQVSPQANNAAAQMIGQILTTPRPGGAPQGGSQGGIIGAGIAGVASNATDDSIMIYNDRSNYAEWEFIFDPAKQKIPPNPITGAIGNPNAAQTGAGQQQQQNPNPLTNGPSPSPFGQSPTVPKQ